MRSSTSRNADGSSSAYRSTFCSRHDATATFCSSPPDRDFTCLLYSFLIFSGSRICSSAVLPSMGASFALSSTAITSAEMSPCRYWGLYAIFTFCLMVPVSGSTLPAIILIMVVLPKAFAPIIPSISPFRTRPASIATENVG